MANRCEICGKGRGVGNNVSHSNNRTKRVWKPNIQRMRALHRGSVRRINVCTRCLRSARVTKPTQQLKRSLA